MATRTLNFVRAGEKDASEVTISTGTHTASIAAATERLSYTISYPGTGGGGNALKEQFAAAAQAIIDDAKARGEPLGGS